MFSIDDAKKWAAENFEALDADRLSSDDECVRMFNRMMPDLSQALWNSGCWLAEQLESHGASQDEISEIQMAQGQRSFGSDPWRAAVDYVNEFAETGDTKEKGGALLAEKINLELM